MTSRMKIVLAAIVVVVLAAAGVVILRQHARHAATRPVVTTAPAVPAPAAPDAAVADCLRPGPGPAQPNGATATAGQMQAARAGIQTYVLQLEAYQTCRNAEIDHAAPGVTDQQKQQWTDMGNGAVDEANSYKGAFAAQIAAFKAAHPGQ